MDAARSTPRAWLILPVLLFLAAFYVYPLWEILALGLVQAAQDLSALAPAAVFVLPARHLLHLLAGGPVEPADRGRGPARGLAPGPP